MKTLFSICFLLLSIATVNAQETPEKKFWLGPTLGLNKTSWHGDKIIEHPDYETSYNLGGKFKYDLSDRLSLNGYLLYSGRKFEEETGFLLEEKYNYLDVPITVTYEFGNGNIKFYPMLGLHNAFLLEGRVRYVDYNNPTETIKYDFYSDYPADIKPFKYHIGYTAGIGNEFELSQKWRLFLEARYTRSFVRSYMIATGYEVSWFDNFGGDSEFGDQEFFSFNVGVLF